MSKWDRVNTNHYCNYSSGVELESGVSRNFYLSFAEREAVFCLFQSTGMLISRPLQQKIGMRVKNSKRFQADMWLHIHYCRYNWSDGKICDLPLHSVREDKEKYQVPQRPKGSELFTSGSELNMVRSQGYGTGSWSSSWHQVGLPDLANKNIGCWLNSDFRKLTNNILAYACPEYCILLQYFIFLSKILI